MFASTVELHLVYEGPGVKSESKPKGPEGKPHKTEFHQVYADFTTDLKTFRDKYPLTTLISIVVFGIIGFFNVLSIFTPTAMIAGALLLGLSTCLALSIGKDPSGFKDAVFASLSQVKNAVFNGGEKADKK